MATRIRSGILKHGTIADLSTIGSDCGKGPRRGVGVGWRDVSAGGLQLYYLSGTDLWVLFGARYRSDDRRSVLTAMGL